MKSTSMVYAILVFGIIVSITVPRLLSIVFETDTEVYEAEASSEVISSAVSGTDELAYNVDNVEVSVASSSYESEDNSEEVVSVESDSSSVDEEVVEEVSYEEEDPVVYDGMTMDELASKLDRSLSSTLSGTGYLFAKYALDYGVDPYLSVSIVLLETGCKWGCSAQVKQCNNVGGMKSGGTGKCNGTSYAYFSSLEEGIRAFMYNLKVNYYDYGLTTAETMGSKYASSSSWASKVNSYMKSVKSA